jgi:hypothetical protein
MDASRYLGFFLLLYTLQSYIPISYMAGIGTTIEDLESLGKNQVSFANYQKLGFLHGEEVISDADVSKARMQFLQMEPDHDRVMTGYMGLSLRYSYYAMDAFRRQRPDELVLDLAIAGEARVSTNTRTTKNFVNRLSALASRDAPPTTNLATRLGRSYRLRREIVQGSAPASINLKELREFSDCIRTVIMSALSQRRLAKTDFCALLDGGLP